MREKTTIVKWVGLGAVGFFVLVWLVGRLGSSHSAEHNTRSATEKSAIVHATNNEELRYLTAKMTELTQQNKQVLADNVFLKGRIKRTGSRTLSAAQQKMQARMTRQATQLRDLRNRMDALKNTTTKAPGVVEKDYPVNAASPLHPSVSRSITTLSDVSLPPVVPVEKDRVHAAAFLKTTASYKTDREPAQQDRPYFSIPANATLADVVLQSDILAEVPVNNTLLQPAFTFKAIVGRRALLASNGFTLPRDLGGIVFEGYSVGNMAMSCARGYITKLLFTWQDGSFTVVGSTPKGTNLNPQETLGYITTPFGNPCLPGKYMTDAPRVIASIALMGGLVGTANAFAKTQTTQAFTAYGSATQVSGNAFHYMGGKMLGTAANKALAWYTTRVNGIFDVVYIPASVGNQPTHVVINITQTIPIDKKHTGRKIRYGNSYNNFLAAHRLD